MRRIIETLVLLCLAGLIGRTWCVQGLLVPFQVTSSSMAETLAGPHRAVACADCRFPFLYGSDDDADRQWAECPNCGHVENDPLENPRSPGDRLLIDRSAFLFRSPRRWEVVAFRAPDAASNVYVKRVVGLPGESIEIRDGDVYVDGQIARKSLAQQRAMAILAHDARWSPQLEPAPPPRWQAEAGNTAWRRFEEGFLRCPSPKTGSEGLEADGVDWLTYVHGRRVAAEPGRSEPSPVTDQYGYNPAVSPRRQQPVPLADLILSFRIVSLQGEGRLCLRATDGREQFVVEVEPTRRCCTTLRNGQAIDAQAPYRLPESWENVRVEVSLVDRQFLLALDERPAIVLPYDRGPAPAQTAARPFSIGGSGIALEIRDLRVYRDVYYRQAPEGEARPGHRAQVQLAPDEYFVLGDNSPVSQDSRTWQSGAGVAVHRLVGRPLLVHLPLRGIAVGPRTFQVPDVARIRYIR